MVFGTGITIDKAVGILDEAVVEMFPTIENFGTTPTAIAAAQRAQDLFAPKTKPRP